MLSMSLAGCHLQIGETYSVFKESKSFSPGCLNNIDQFTYDYFHGKAVHSQANQMFVCVKNALNLFKTYIYGKQKGVFTPNELRQFIHKFILQDRTINNTLLHQMAILKTILVGGNVHTLTSKDIDRFIAFLNVIKNEALFLQPHIQAIYNLDNTMYTNNHNRPITKDFIESINRISIFLNNLNASYSFSNMHTLIREVDLLINKGNASISHLRHKINSAKTLHQFVFNKSTDTIEPGEWRRLLLSSSYLAASTIHYLCLQKQEHWLTPKSTHSIYLILNNLREFLSESTRSQPHHTIQKKRLLQLALYLQSLNIIPEYFSQKSIHNILTILFGKVFNTDKTKYGVIQISTPELKKMQWNLDTWANTQSLLNQTVKKHSLSLTHPLTLPLIKQTQSTPSLFQKVHNKPPAYSLNYLNTLFSLKPLHKAGWQVRLSHNMFLPANNQTHTHRILTIHHFYKTLMHMIKTGYQQKYSSTRGLMYEELVDFLTDLNPIAVDMGWFQQTDDELFNVGEVEFILANTLTPSTPGFNIDWQQPEHLTEEEMIEYFSYSLSIYLSLKKIEPILSQKCIYPGNEEYNINCVRESLLPVITMHLDNMPDLIKKIQSMSAAQQKNLTEALIHISFNSEETYQAARHLTRWHLKNILTSLYFVETVINRFDTNRDNILQHKEIWDAFPIFHGYLNHTIAISLGWPEGLSIAPDLYAYVIANKNMPYKIKSSLEDQLYADWHDRWQIVSHQIWQQCQNQSSPKCWLPNTNWTLEMDMIHLIQVFSAVIKSFVNEKYKQVQTTKTSPLPKSKQTSLQQ